MPFAAVAFVAFGEVAGDFPAAADFGELVGEGATDFGEADIGEADLGATDLGEADLDEEDLGEPG